MTAPFDKNAPLTAEQWLEHSMSGIDGLIRLFMGDGWKVDCSLIHGLTIARGQINEALQILRAQRSAEGRITPFGPDLSKLAPEHRAEIERFQRSLDEDDAPGPAAWLRKYAGTVNDPDVNVRLSMAADEIDRLMAAQSHVATTCEHGQAKECEQCFDLASPINAASQSTGCTIAAGKSASATGERADAHLPASAAPSSTRPTTCPKAGWKSGTNGTWTCEWPQCNCALSATADSKMLLDAAAVIIRRAHGAVRKMGVRRTDPPHAEVRWLMEIEPQMEAWLLKSGAGFGHLHPEDQKALDALGTSDGTAEGK